MQTMRAGQRIDAEDYSVARTLAQAARDLGFTTIVRRHQSERGTHRVVVLGPRKKKGARAR